MKLLILLFLGLAYFAGAFDDINIFALLLIAAITYIPYRLFVWVFA